MQRSARRKPRSLVRNGKTLSRKNIKRKTGKQSQAKQIMALNRKVNKIAKMTTTRFSLSWYRKGEIIQVVQPDTKNEAYILPCPTAPCDPFNSLTTNVSRAWTDNRFSSNNQTYLKAPIFQVAEDAKNAKYIQHTGSKLKYQLCSSEPKFAKVHIALIRPKKAYADQLVTDRKLTTGTNPGSESFLERGLDYNCHPGEQGTGALSETIFGVTWDRTKWDVLYKREHAFSHPGATNMAVNVNPSNWRTSNNAVTCSGTIYIPPAKKPIRNISLKVTGEINKDPAPTALETCILDEENEDRCYLVCISNGSRIDGEQLTMACVVHDYYTAQT